MLLFGVVVVLLLLNLLIARFAKTFDMVYESVDEARWPRAADHVF